MVLCTFKTFSRFYKNIPIIFPAKNTYSTHSNKIQVQAVSKKAGHTNK